MGAAIGMDTDELFNDEDLDYTCQTSGLRSHGGKATAGSSSRNHMVGQVESFLCPCTKTCSLERAKKKLNIYKSKVGTSYYCLSIWMFNGMPHNAWAHCCENLPLNNAVSLRFSLSRCLIWVFLGKKVWQAQTNLKALLCGLSLDLVLCGLVLETQTLVVMMAWSIVYIVCLQDQI